MSTPVDSVRWKGAGYNDDGTPRRRETEMVVVEEKEASEESGSESESESGSSSSSSSSEGEQPEASGKTPRTPKTKMHPKMPNSNASMNTRSPKPLASGHESSRKIIETISEITTKDVCLENTFETKILVSFDGNDVVGQPFEVLAEKAFLLKEKDIDKLLSVGKRYEGVITPLNHIFIISVTPKVISNTSGNAYGLVASCKTGNDDSAGYWNELNTNGGNCMLFIPPSHTEVFEHACPVVDNTKEMQSSAFTNFGYASETRLRSHMREITGRTHVEHGSLLHKIILENLDVLNKESKILFEPSKPGFEEIVIVEGKNFIRIPPEIVAKAISIFSKRFIPLIKGLMNLRDNTLAFKLNQLTQSSTSTSSKKQVHVELHIKYTFPIDKEERHLERAMEKVESEAAIFEAMLKQS